MKKLTEQSISEDVFIRRFRPIVNHIDPSAAFDCGNGGCMFETYGEAYEFVLKQNSDCIWTLIEGDDKLHVISGVHFVNRFGYLISAVPVPAGHIISVELDTDIPD
jgi:hypothetical protein